MNDTPNWHKSAYSHGDNDDCVEVATNQPKVLFRDTKVSQSPVIEVTRSAWSAFLDIVTK
ncbi:DUF397 domain-containing protein [Streptomyces noursei]|uniref:DUF397 domain-containing protein n=1 Tax=Streptomyces noursei TaxID=1971 RepID=A0A2N8PE74_STRNR|nr:DUF397 domain-containing protein [Streptomyces noursei]PNE39321.1 hypothetical protein AOB60_36190 [Streptomyces noursei]